MSHKLSQSARFAARKVRCAASPARCRGIQGLSGVFSRDDDVGDGIVDAQALRGALLFETL
jgi:hypothetical protein